MVSVDRTAISRLEPWALFAALMPWRAPVTSLFAVTNTTPPPFLFSALMPSLLAPLPVTAAATDTVTLLVEAPTRRPKL